MTNRSTEEPQFFGPVELTGGAFTLTTSWQGRVHVVKYDPDGAVEPYGPLSSAQAFALSRVLASAAAAANELLR